MIRQPGTIRTELESESPTIRTPCADDGQRLWLLVQEIDALESNSPYTYVLIADLFGDTCAIAETGDHAVGCVIGLRPPRHPRVLFVWQVGVLREARGRGLTHRMLEAILARPACAALDEIQATVAPDNAASLAMFRGFATKHGAKFQQLEGYAAETFPPGHAAERLIRIRGFGQMVQR